MKLENGVWTAKDKDGNVLMTADFERAYLWARGYGDGEEAGLRYWADVVKTR